MRRRSLPLVLALTLVPLACKVSTSDTSAPAKDGADDEAKPDADDADAGTAKPDGPKPGRAADEDPGGLPECPADAGDDSYCTDDGKLAGRWVMADMLRIPASAELIFEAKHAEAEGQPSLSVAIDGDELYIKQVTCGSCARVLGQGFRGALSSMSEAQIRAVEDRLGLPEGRDVLTSTAQWREYAASEAGTEALTELSTVTDR